MWLIDIIEAFGALNLAPFAIGGASVVTLITGALIYSTNRRGPVADIEDEDEFDYEETEERETVSA